MTIIKKIIILLLFTSLSFAQGNFPLITIYSKHNGADIYRAVGFQGKFVKIGKIKNGQITFKNYKKRFSTFKLLKLSEDGMWRYEAIITANDIPKGSHTYYTPIVNRYATQKRLNSLLGSHQTNEEKIIKEKEANFIQMKKNMIYDKKNKIIWQDTTDNETEVGVKGYAAQQYCQELVLNGFAYWRLPTYKELLDTVEYSSKTYMVPIFKHVKADAYWTAGKNIYQGAMVINMNNGNSYYSYSNNNQYRCVKDFDRNKEK